MHRIHSFLLSQKPRHSMGQRWLNHVLNFETTRACKDIIQSERERRNSARDDRLSVGYPIMASLATARTVNSPFDEVLFGMISVLLGQVLSRRKEQARVSEREVFCEEREELAG